MPGIVVRPAPGEPVRGPASSDPMTAMYVPAGAPGLTIRSPARWQKQSSAAQNRGAHPARWPSLPTRRPGPGCRAIPARQGCVPVAGRQTRTAPLRSGKPKLRSVRRVRCDPDRRLWPARAGRSWSVGRRRRGLDSDWLSLNFGRRPLLAPRSRPFRPRPGPPRSSRRNPCTS
jgi:hypothetical protein